MVWLFSPYGESRAKYNLIQPIPLQVEHAAVNFIVEPFRPSGSCLRTMKISAQWCHVETNYFTHYWETRGEQERLIPSRTGPKDLPTAHINIDRTFSRRLMEIIAHFLRFRVCVHLCVEFPFNRLPIQVCAWYRQYRHVSRCLITVSCWWQHRNNSLAGHWGWMCFVITDYFTLQVFDMSFATSLPLPPFRHSHLSSLSHSGLTLV